MRCPCTRGWGGRQPPRAPPPGPGSAFPEPTAGAALPRPRAAPSAPPRAPALPGPAGQGWPGQVRAEQRGAARATAVPAAPAPPAARDAAPEPTPILPWSLGGSMAAPRPSRCPSRLPRLGSAQLGSTPAPAGAWVAAEAPPVPAGRGCRPSLSGASRPGERAPPAPHR